jgi:hypothetical protein
VEESVVASILAKRESTERNSILFRKGKEPHAVKQLHKARKESVKL